MTDLLSPLEAIMWRVGQDATLRMTVGVLVVVDHPPTLDALAERLAVAADQAPRLRRRPEDGAALRSRPAWVDDDDPAPDHHLRSLSVAEPGSMRQVLDLVGLLESIPFDPGWSPWDVTLIEGLEGGQAAVYLRAHHVLTDGIGGIRLLGLLLDEPEWPRVAPKRTAGGQAGGGGTDGQRRPRARHVDDHRRPAEGGAAGDEQHQRCPRRRSGRLRRAGDPGCARSRQLRLAPVDGHRRTALVAARIAVAAQPLRADLRRGGKGSGAGARREPQRPPRRRCGGRPRRLPRQARPAGAAAAAGDTDQPASQPRGRRQLVRPGTSRGAHCRRAAGTAVRDRRRTAGAGAQGAGVAGGVAGGADARPPADPNAAAGTARPGRLRRLRRHGASRPAGASVTSADR